MSNMKLIVFVMGREVYLGSAWPGVLELRIGGPEGRGTRYTLLTAPEARKLAIALLCEAEKWEHPEEGEQTDGS